MPKIRSKNRFRWLPARQRCKFNRNPIERDTDVAQDSLSPPGTNDLADRNLIRVEVGSEGYPPDLETLVKGVQLGAGNDRKIRFLRNIPKDPITGQAEWGLRAVQDDPDPTSWGGKNVFDVYSKSQGTASDGTRYANW